MKNRVNKCVVMLAILCVLVMAFAVPFASAASYSKVYGQTQAKIRVRESASTNATIIDNIVKNACVYVTSSKTSGSNTFIQIKYIASDGSTQTGWVCQSDGKETYVKILSATQAQSTFKVSGGSLPSTKVGTFTSTERKASASNSDSTYIRSGSSGETVKSLQTKLKALGFYSGEITGNVGTKTEAAIKAFQRKYGLTADGIAGPQTIAKIDAAYASSGNSTSSSSSSSSGLKLGSSGTDVRNLQQDLTTLGYYWAEITGSFGSKTETAVKRFQEENGLTADGVAGSKTLAAIATAVAKKGGTSSSSSSSSSSGTTLKLNSQGTLVSQLQQDLMQLGYYYAEITGNFGSKTEAAVKKFQTAKGLTADGVAGTKTLAAIASAISAAGGSTSSSSSSSTSGLKLGSTGDKVRALQEDLTTLGYYYGDITGHYGSMTQTAVKKFQKARGLTQDGVAGTTTINAIASALKNGGSLSSSSSGVTTALREGDSGTAVKDLQTRLKSLGYYYGDLTGNFGSLTRQAVRKFQDANSLTVDGIAGTATLNKLYSLTGGSSSSSSSSGGTVVNNDDSYGRISKNNVNLRKSYSTTSSAIASLAQGTKVRITKTYTVNSVSWYYVSVNVGSYTYKGYVRSDMVEKISATDFGDDDIDIGDAEILGMIRVTANNVRLREDASTDSDSVGTANTGDVFYYIDTEDGWFQTKAGYWISKDYVKVMTDEEVDNYTGSNSSGSSYSEGDTGSMVKWIQETLKALGYYEDGTVTGNYGRLTKEAVRQFQRDHDLSADGVCGPKTIAALQAEVNDDSSSTTNQGYNPVVYNLSWFNNLSTINSLGVVRNGKGTLTDISTGRSFRIKVQSTGNHVDAEPLTSADTAVLCSLYNVSTAAQLVSGNKYQRRPMVLTADKSNVQFICSIYAIPHGDQTISNNSYDGQFCLHFLDSKTHKTNRVDTDTNGHQAMIKKGVTKLQEKGVQVLTTYGQ